MKKRVPSILIMIGVLLICIPLMGNLYTRYQQDKMIQEYEQSLVTQADQLSRVFEEVPLLTDSLQEDEARQKPVKKEEPEQVLGKISIPAIGSTLLLVEGTQSRQLRWGAGHLSGSAYPGEPGNCILAAHRDYTFGTYFSRLDELKAGDEVLLEYQGSTYRYRVLGSYITDPQDVSPLMSQEEALLTLITCHPRGSGKQRLIVTAEPA